ncbi:hypothetical protein DICPUDRAFT_49884 [Dictyostelium purpureum]|uniref:DNA polymerase n=1 Tax=Dictyostelium purpureum TaxID=5786 RepID=F0ZVS2_DICPU|nr:uncharacterized protein DICPUDRAFT_49884 [Dictyostelium purpureum]EGC31947.1 hypothetical protein DICPUDRAFT_49884 [Dictyostelium purpureum]|eukprot:XP_003291516.1 hypothetical protein DICPUDRAFT_49884 [Dictyostelium purpureum]
MDNRPKREKKTITDNSTLKSIELIRRARSTGEKRTAQLQKEDEEKKKQEEEEEEAKKNETEFDKEERKRKNRDFIEGDDGYREKSDNENGSGDDEENSEDDFDDHDLENEENDQDYSSEEEAIEVGRKKRNKKKTKQDGENEEKKPKAKRAPRKPKEKPQPEIPKRNIMEFLNPTVKTNDTGSSFFFDKLKKDSTNTTSTANSSKSTNGELDFDAMLEDLQSAPVDDLDIEQLKVKQQEMEEKLKKEKEQKEKEEKEEKEAQVSIKAEPLGLDEDPEFEFDMEFSNPAPQNNIIIKNTPSTNTNKAPKITLPTKQQFISPKTQGDDWWSKSDDSVVSVKKLEEIMPTNADLVEKNKDGSLEFFLLSTEEDRQGKIILFGKIKTNTTTDKKKDKKSTTSTATSGDKYSSCCIFVENMIRNVFFLPRDYILDESGESTTIQTTDERIEKEIKSLMEKNRIKDYKIKKVKRTSAFDYQVAHKNLPISEELNVWKVSYPSTHPALPNDIQGSTFRCAYGITSSPSELFLLKRKIMGPSWLTISAGYQMEFSIGQKKSYCRYEIKTKSFKDITPSKAIKPSPPLVVMSISTKSLVKDSSHEIVMISAVIHEKISCDGPTQEESNVKFITAIRPLSGKVFPPEFQKKDSTNQNLTICTSESNLLSFFCDTILNIDPDVLAGHNIDGYDIEILFDRLEKLKVIQWSQIGRLRKRNFDKYNTISGRLICDSYLVCKEFLPKEKNYSLVELCKSQLGIENKQEINYLAIEPYYDTAKKLNIFIEINENDCFVIFKLIFKLLVFPLTKQLTNLAGNQWNKSLKSNRAERIEYLLLHNFYEKKYLLPDKVYQSIKKDSSNSGYSGGLVLDPKIDFYDRYVVLLDFNSLYPSIIQEFNVCFTTIPRERREDGKWVEAEPPSSSIKKGILPTVLKSLVGKRREIKKKMENEKNETQKKQLDIQQQAVKLIANSMYGCLGFSNSRFFALPLAELVTRKGRENLQKGVSIVGKMNYEVVYGDTDSLMVYTGVPTFNEAETIGREIQKKINESYRNSVMEIGLDGIFKRLLLFKKKKYACLKEYRIDANTTATERENKGLDIVRRDYCGLTKEMGQYLLDLILSGEEKIVLFTLIKEYLEKTSQKLKENSYEVDKFVITKTLSKPIEDYNDADIQPHVQVAILQKNKGHHIQVGDQVPYVITKGDKEWYQRARDPKDVESMEDIDTDWYLSQQILPSIQRNTGPIGTEGAQLATWLGMTNTKYQRPDSAASAQSEYDKNRQIVWSSEDFRYKQCKSFSFECPYCYNDNEFTSVTKANNDDQIRSGFDCAHCNAKVPIKKLLNQLQINIRNYLKQYNNWDLQCTECEKVSKSYKENSYRCQRPQCRGKMIQSMTSSKLFNQISYFLKLFKTDHVNNLSDSIPVEDQNIIKQAKQIIESFLSKFEQYNVDLSSLLLKEQSLSSFNGFLLNKRNNNNY